MKRLLILAVLVAAAIAGFRAWDASHVVTADRSRVEDLLDAVRDNDEQRAISQWSEGKNMLDMEGLKRYADQYQRFVEASGLAGGTSWDVTEVRRDEALHETMVTVSRDGRQVALRVRKYVPIELASAD